MDDFDAANVEKKAEWKLKKHRTAEMGNQHERDEKQRDEKLLGQKKLRDLFMVFEPNIATREILTYSSFLDLLKIRQACTWLYNMVCRGMDSQNGRSLLDEAVFLSPNFGELVKKGKTQEDENPEPDGELVKTGKKGKSQENEKPEPDRSVIGFLRKLHSKIDATFHDLGKKGLKNFGIFLRLKHKTETGFKSKVAGLCGGYAVTGYIYNKIKSKTSCTTDIHMNITNLFRSVDGQFAKWDQNVGLDYVLRHICDIQKTRRGFVPFEQHMSSRRDAILARLNYERLHDKCSFFGSFFRYLKEWEVEILDWNFEKSHFLCTEFVICDKLDVPYASDLCADRQNGLQKYHDLTQYLDACSQSEMKALKRKIEKDLVLDRKNSQDELCSVVGMRRRYGLKREAMLEVNMEYQKKRRTEDQMEIKKLKMTMKNQAKIIEDQSKQIQELSEQIQEKSEQIQELSEEIENLRRLYVVILCILLFLVCVWWIFKK